LGHVLAGRLLVLAERFLFRPVGLLQLTNRSRQPLQLLPNALHFLERGAEFVGPETFEVAEDLEVLLNVVARGSLFAGHLDLLLSAVHQRFVALEDADEF